MSKRDNRLYEISLKILNGTLSKSEAEEDPEWNDSVTADEIARVVDRLISEGIPFETLKPVVSKILNLYYKALEGSRYRGEDPFLSALATENRAIVGVLDKGKQILRRLNRNTGEPGPITELKSLLIRLGDLKIHYEKMENLVFPRLENGYPHWRCVRLLWSIHDDVRRDLKQTLSICESGPLDIMALNRNIGRLYFGIHTVIFREEAVLFPLMDRMLTETDREAIHRESREYGSCLVESPEPESSSRDKQPATKGKANALPPPIPLPEPELLTALFGILPLDLTLLNAEDKVVWFSEGAERIFPRSRSVIGRDVRNCHPAESVDKVERILDQFRNGTSDRETFWIRIRGKVILIEYFPLRSPSGEYLGTLETTRDITGIIGLDGEKRL